jgi:hypothetical protein
MVAVDFDLKRIANRVAASNSGHEQAEETKVLSLMVTLLVERLLSLRRQGAERSAQ